MPVALALVWLTLGAAEPPAADPSLPQPFLRLRESTLDYRGPEADLARLTEIRIGWFGPTNLDDPLTGDLWWAANHAVQQANQAISSSSGVQTGSPPPAVDPRLAGLFFRLVPRWAVNPWGTGVALLTRMVYEEQPLAIIGSVDSASTHLAEQVVAKANLPLISPIATDPSITLAGVPWMFSCAPSDAAIARVMVDTILTALTEPSSPTPDLRSPISDLRSPISETPRLALLTTTDHDSRMAAREVVRELSRRRRPPSSRFEFSPGVADFTRQLAALSTARPDAVLVMAGAEDSARLVRAVRGLEWEPRGGAAGGKDTVAGSGGPMLFGGVSMARRRFQELVGPAGEGVQFPLVVDATEDKVEAVGFVDAFTAARQHPPDYAAILTYDAARLLIEAIRRAGPERARIRTALVGLSPWQGLGGVIHFDGTGQNARTNIAMATVRGGRIEQVRP